MALSDSRLPTTIAGAARSLQFSIAQRSQVLLTSRNCRLGSLRKPIFVGSSSLTSKPRVTLTLRFSPEAEGLASVMHKYSSSVPAYLDR